MKILVQLSRVLVGVLFIFSGLIKLNDPMGFSFKLNDYFAADVLDLPFLVPFALAIALVLVIVEILLGLALLLGYQKKITIWLLFAMILFFTFLTFYSAYFNKVTDCGCFGDAIPLTPWESFSKDVVLMVLILIIMVGKNFIQPLLNNKSATVVLGVSLVLCSSFGYYVLNHLPVKDFRAYAEGKSIVEGMKSAEELGLQGPVYEVIYTMKKIDGDEQQEITSTQYMDEKWWEKTDWMMLEELSRSIKVSDGYEPPVHDFGISTDYGEITDEVLSAPDYLLIISYRMSEADVDGFKKIADLAWDLENENLPFLAISTTSGQDAETFKHKIQAPFEFATMDETTLKTIVRSNPGLVWIKNGLVYKKWHHNDVPSAEEIKAMR